LVKPEEVKELHDLEITATPLRFRIVIPLKDSRIALSFDMKDAKILRGELDEWIDIGTVVQATKRRTRKSATSMAAVPPLSR
jgi:hypothetical protein